MKLMNRARSIPTMEFIVRYAYEKRTKQSKYKLFSNLQIAGRNNVLWNVTRLGTRTALYCTQGENPGCSISWPSDNTFTELIDLPLDSTITGTVPVSNKNSPSFNCISDIQNDFIKRWAHIAVLTTFFNSEKLCYSLSINDLIIKDLIW